MNERTLKDFFLGRISAKDLASDVAGSVSHHPENVTVVHIRDMDDSFVINRQMALSLCDAVLRDHLPSAMLATIGFALLASDLFEWEEDDLLANIINDWSCPEVNWPLTKENVARCREWLMEREAYPAKPKSTPITGNISNARISVTTKNPTRWPKVSAFVYNITSPKIQFSN